MNQLEAFLFLTSCEFFLLGGGRENTTLTKKPGHVMHFQFSIKKMKIKIKVNSKIDI